VLPRFFMRAESFACVAGRGRNLLKFAAMRCRYMAALPSGPSEPLLFGDFPRPVCLAALFAAHFYVDRIELAPSGGAVARN
jgi:hypothetical protein